MKKYLYIGKLKKPLNNNYDDKCPYLKSLSEKRINEFQNIEKIKNDIITDRLLKEDEFFQRDYAFFSVIKPGYKEIKKFPKIKIFPGFKYTFKSDSEKNKSYQINKKFEYDKILKNNLICFPRDIKYYILKKSKSLVHLPIIKK